MPCSPRQQAAVASAGDAAPPERHRAGIRRRALVGGAVPTLRQPTTGRRLCRPGADTLAERLGRSRARGLESRQSEAANDDDPAGLAVGAPSAALGAHPVVSRSGSGATAAASRRQRSSRSPASCSSRCGSTSCGRRHRRRRHEDRLRHYPN